MIAIDTNVIVRYLVRDNPEQADAAKALLETLTNDQPGFICREVMVEIVWVLERAYKFARERIADVMVELTVTEGLIVESADDVNRAFISYRQSGPGFSDLMIKAAAGRVGARSLYTFDRRLARQEGVSLVGAEESELPLQ